MTKRITMKDVANLAGVSTTTVSHVLNDTRHVNDETRKQVESAMAELNYKPNALARGLRAGETRTIGLLLPDASNPFFAEIASEIEDQGYQQGYNVILGNSHNDPDRQLNYINDFLAKQMDGVIFISTGGEEGDLLPLQNNNIPIVVADRDAPLELADVVLLDNEKAGYEVTKYLIDLGHRCIACITGPNELSLSNDRVKGYRRALEEFGLPYQQELIRSGDFQFKGGKKAMASLLKESCLPSAVFVLNDIMAIGAMTEAREADLSIPEDLSIVGFDDIELASAIAPALTTMAQPIEEMARIIMNLLVERISGKKEKGNNQRVILSANLMERQSTVRRAAGS